jgi:hypothetical protein
MVLRENRRRAALRVAFPPIEDDWFLLRFGYEEVFD